MKISGNSGFSLLLVGDIFVLFASIWFALVFRYHTFPSFEALSVHVGHFAFLILLWLVVFYGAGLYDRFAFDFEKKLPAILMKSQFLNAVLSVGYFYFFSDSIAPKTILFIYLIISSALILLWRLFVFTLVHKPAKQKVVLIGQGESLRELNNEILNSKKYGMSLVRVFDRNGEASSVANMKEVIEKEAVDIVIIDQAQKEIMNTLYPLIFRGVRFERLDEVYERIFSRIPLEVVDSEWFLLNVYAKTHATYRLTKRVMDFVLASLLLLVTAPFFPLVMFVIWLDDRGRAFIVQERIGKDGQLIHIPKFRTMSTNDQGKWLTAGDSRVTRIGYFLRKSRIDELPQLWSVLKGDLSLIGPRPDIIGLGKELEKQIPFYGVRNVVEPGLSGWAQISQDLPPQSVEETRLRLAYDLYYVKNRSLSLDIEIALKTGRILLSRLGM